MPISQDRLYSIVTLARTYRNLAHNSARTMRARLDELRQGQITTKQYVDAIIALINEIYTEVNTHEARLVAEEIQYRATANRNRSEKERRERLRRAEGRPIRRQAPEMSWSTIDPAYATPQQFETIVPRGSLGGRGQAADPDFKFDATNLDAKAVAASLMQTIVPNGNDLRVDVHDPYAGQRDDPTTYTPAEMDEAVLAKRKEIREMIARGELPEEYMPPDGDLQFEASRPKAAQ